MKFKEYFILIIVFLVITCSSYVSCASDSSCVNTPIEGDFPIDTLPDTSTCYQCKSDSSCIFNYYASNYLTTSDTSYYRIINVLTSLLIDLIIN